MSCYPCEEILKAYFEEKLSVGEIATRFIITENVVKQIIIEDSRPLNVIE